MFAKLHHAAYRCADAAETVHFYRDILGLPFAHALSNDYVPSIKIYAPHIHIFFQLKDGSYIAFFEVPLGGDLAKVDRCQHIAFEVEDRDRSGGVALVLNRGGEALGKIMTLAFTPQGGVVK